MKTPTKIILAVVGLLFISAIIAALFPARRQAEQNAVANSIRQYEITKHGGTAMDAYFQAGLVAAAFLQIGDEENYNKWKDIERIDGRNAGVRVQANYDDVLKFKQSQDSKHDSMDDLRAAMEARRRNAGSQPIAPAPEPDAPSSEYLAKLKASQEKARLARPPIADRPAMPAITPRDDKPTSLEKALASAPYRKWKALGGKDASEAKITGYENGRVTIEKRDGQTKVFKVSDLGKADRDYVQSWLDAAGL